MNNNYTSFSSGNPFSSQAKLVLHYNSVYEYLSKGDVSSPIFMEVGLTNKCNMECAWCITENGRDNKTGASIDIDTLKSFLEEFYNMGGKAITFAGQGEPTFYRHFEEATLHAKKLGLKLGLMTNGVYKNKYSKVIGENFEWIRISLDTVDVQDYKKWKLVDGVDVVKKNCDALNNYPVRVGINCNVGSNITIQHAKELIEWVNCCDAISYLQFRPVLPRYYKVGESEYKTSGNIDLNIDVWNYLDSIKSDIGKINLSNDKRNDILNGTAFKFRSCEGHFFEPILAATGEVKICTYHPDNNNLTFGNINDSSFFDIWRGNQRKSAIEYARNMNYRSECQVCCKLSEPNKLIDFLTHPDEMVDVDFL